MEHGCEAPLQIVVNWHGVVATVTATGELDIATATPLTQQLLVVAAEHPERVALDLSGLLGIPDPRPKRRCQPGGPAPTTAVNARPGGVAATSLSG